MHGIGTVMKSGLKVAVLAVALTALAGCAEKVRSHGYVPSEADLQQITVGVDTRATVEDVVGVPSTSGVLDNSGFYYVESQVRHFAWQRPKVTERQIVAINFDGAGVVSNITTYGLQDGRVVPLTRRVTETPDSNIGFIRKLFGNIGGLDLGNVLGGN